MSINTNSIGRLVLLLVWLLARLYFGSGGITKIENYNLIKTTVGQADTAKVIYQGVTFQNKGALLRKLEEDQMTAIFPWLGTLPSYVSYMITACSFGLLGSLIGILIQIVFHHQNLEDVKIFFFPLLGLLTGLVVLGASLVFPALLFSTDKDIKPSGLMFLCLFCGIFSESFYARLTTLFKKKIDGK